MRTSMNINPRRIGPTLASLSALVLAGACTSGPLDDIGTRTSAVKTVQLELDVRGTAAGAVAWADGANLGTCTSVSPADSKTCYLPVNVGDVVTLTATPAGTAVFAGWIGSSCSGTASACSFTVTASAAVGVAFSTSANPTLSLTVLGLGSVTSAPPAIACNPGGTGSICQAEFAPGNVTLTAVANPGQSFEGWSGGPCAGNLTTTCSFSIAAGSPLAVNAGFTGFQPALTVVLVGTGKGGVTSVPAGIGCGTITGDGTHCSAPFNPVTEITLTATPVAGSVFTGWTEFPSQEAACSGLGTCTVTMDYGTGRQIQARFDLPGTGAISAGASSLTASPLTLAAGTNSTITVVVKDNLNNPYAGATVALKSSGLSSASFAAASGTTDATGTYSTTLSATYAGTATVTATATGTAGLVTLSESAIVTFTGSVDAGTVAPAVTSSISGVITGALGTGVISTEWGPIGGATVCLEGAAGALLTTTCTTSAATTGAYTISGVAPGSYFVWASATGLNNGESAVASPTATTPATAINIILSGQPVAGVAYDQTAPAVTCGGCHSATSTSSPGPANAGAHTNSVLRNLSSATQVAPLPNLTNLDLAGWPAAPTVVADPSPACSNPNTQALSFQATDPATGLPGAVSLLVDSSACSPQVITNALAPWNLKGSRSNDTLLLGGQSVTFTTVAAETAAQLVTDINTAVAALRPDIVASLDGSAVQIISTTQTGFTVSGSSLTVLGLTAGLWGGGKYWMQVGTTKMEVDGTVGGVATGAGQCGLPGMIPASATCSNGSTDYWKQEYIMNVQNAANGNASTPGWTNYVTWNITNTKDDQVILPAAWTGRGHEWVLNTDYNPTQAGGWAKSCSGCHETGIKLQTDGTAANNVTSYTTQIGTISCESCHGPGSGHPSKHDNTKIVFPAYLTANSANEVCGQCHENGVTSATGGFPFPWNDPTNSGVGNFIPGADSLANWLSVDPAYQNPADYWQTTYASDAGPATYLFPKKDHMHFQDFEGSAHGVTATHEKLICADCHNAHTLQGGPGDMVAKYGATSTSPAASNTAFGPGLSGIEYVDTATIPGFQSQPYTYVYYPGNYGLTGPSNMALQTDLVCLRCHASHTFGLTQLEIAQYAADPASAGGVGESNGIVDGGVISNVTINGVVLGADGGPPADTCVQPGGTLPDGGTLPLTSDETCASQQAVASAVEYHMLQYAGMPAPFDPTGVKTGLPIGRCASCHMAKTAATGQYFEDLDSTGRTANVIGDVSSHPFAVAAPNGVALPSLSLPSWNAATTGQWQEVMPNACGSCHADYRLGK